MNHTKEKHISAIPLTPEEKARQMKMRIFIVPLVLGIFALFMSSFFDRAYMLLTATGGFFDSIQNILYLLCAFLALSVSWKSLKDKEFVQAGFFLVIFFIMLYATLYLSYWWQAASGFRFPERLQNLYHTSFFNPYLTKIYMLVGLYGVFSRVLLLPFTKNQPLTLLYFTPGHSLVLYFLPVFIVYFIADYGYMVGLRLDNTYGHITWYESTLAEFLLSLGIFIHLCTVKHRQHHEEHTTDEHTP